MSELLTKQLIAKLTVCLLCGVAGDLMPSVLTLPLNCVPWWKMEKCDGNINQVSLKNTHFWNFKIYPDQDREAPAKKMASLTKLTKYKEY